MPSLFNFLIPPSPYIKAYRIVVYSSACRDHPCMPYLSNVLIPPSPYIKSKSHCCTFQRLQRSPLHAIFVQFSHSPPHLTLKGNRIVVHFSVCGDHPCMPSLFNFLTPPFTLHKSISHCCIFQRLQRSPLHAIIV